MAQWPPKHATVDNMFLGNLFLIISDSKSGGSSRKVKRHATPNFVYSLCNTYTLPTSFFFIFRKVQERKQNQNL